MFTPSLKARKCDPKPYYAIRLFRMMERYWDGKPQVAPLEAYQKSRKEKPVQYWRVEDPIDLAVQRDWEGVYLGKYDF